MIVQRLLIWKLVDSYKANIDICFIFPYVSLVFTPTFATKGMMAVA